VQSPWALGVGRWKLSAAPWILAVAYIVAHSFTLAPSLEDIDSINFALGLRHFDPGQHQPHPPGYPIYIAAGRLSLAAVHAVRPAMERLAAEATALSLLSVIAGALAIVCAWRVFGLLPSGAGDDVRRQRVQRWATGLLAVSPLFWITGVRPMSDMPGLAMAFATQALLLSGRLRSGAFLAGLALGVRSQTLWLTMPLLAFLLVERRHAEQAAQERAWRELGMAVLVFSVGALCWAVPMLVATGGLDAYLAALGSQAGEDFAFVDMLWANPTPRRLAFGLIHTLVFPWASIPLAVTLVALAVVGGAVLLARDRRTLAMVLVTFAPYALFHLVFQETITVRYALPVVAPIVFLAATALAVAGPATNIMALPVAAMSLFAAAPAAFAYAGDPHPAFRAIADASTRARADAPAMVTSHFELRRPLRASEPTAMPVTYAPHQREWMELVSYWAGGGRGVVWFLANPRRTDIDLIDPHSRRDVVRYHWQAGDRPELSGTRPADVDWYRMRAPGWFLGEGWSLTPETGGVAVETGTGPDRGPITAHVRRLTVPMHAVVGGRHLGTQADGPAAFEMAIDGTIVDRWTVTPEDANFLRFLELPAGLEGPDGSYATLTIRASAIPVAVRRFDVQPASRVIFGFGPGWHEDEYDSATGLRWRWTSDRAVLRVRGPAPIRVRIRGESPLKYFDATSSITLSAGERMIERIRPSGDWELDVVVPADAIAAADGEVTISASQVFVPSEITGSPDTRRLALRVFAVNIESAR
jgi:hypothetical protein